MNTPPNPAAPAPEPVPPPLPERPPTTAGFEAASPDELLVQLKAGRALSPEPVPIEWSAMARDLTEPVRRFPWARLGRCVLAGNPFYLFSAVLMLYGLYLVSVDPEMFGKELSQLAFNFSSLQLYEVLLVVTALMLARRAIWYDATLLVALENLFAFVPFILISQATFLTPQVTWVVGGAAVALALGKFWTLRRHLRELNFPVTLLAFAAVLLVVNVAFPVTFRTLVQDDNDAWPRLSLQGWLWLMPALVALANLLPRATQRGQLLLQRAWLPLVLYLVWVAATAVNFHSVNYVDDQKFQLALVAPALWVLAMTLWNRVGDFAREPSVAMRTAFQVLPALVPLAAAGGQDTRVLFALTGLNVLIYFIRDELKHDRLSLHLGLASLVLLVPAMPEAWGREMFPDFSRSKALTLALAGYALLLVMFSRRPAHAVLGAIIVGLGTWYEFGRLDYVELFAMQNALLFVLLHSLRWQEERGSRAMRSATVLAWVAHSITWLRVVGFEANAPVLLGGLLVAVVFAFARLATGAWGPLMIGVTAGLVMLAVPVNFSVEKLRITPNGHLAVLGSFVLFALGTALAWTKPRWNSPPADRGDESMPATPAPAK